MGTLDVQRANQLGTEEVRRWMWQRGWDARSDPLVEDRRSDRPPSMARTTGFPATRETVTPPNGPPGGARSL